MLQPAHFFCGEKPDCRCEEASSMKASSCKNKGRRLQQEVARKRKQMELLKACVSWVFGDCVEAPHMAQLRDMSTQHSGNSAALALPAGSGPPTPRSAASRSSSRPSTSRSTPASVGQAKVGIGMVITDLPPHRVVQVVARVHLGAQPARARPARLLRSVRSPTSFTARLARRGKGRPIATVEKQRRNGEFCQGVCFCRCFRDAAVN